MYRASIIVSMYNGAKYLEQFLNNALQLSCFDEVEFLLLDAQSIDNTKSIISKYTQVNLRYELLNKRYSIYDTWNIGIDLASADNIGNWNLDDRRSVYGLEKQLICLEEDKSVDICYGITAWSFKENELFSENPMNQLYPCYDVTFKTLLQHNSPHCMPVWKKRIHKDIGVFNGENYPTAADYDFWMRCLFTGKIFKRLDYVVGSYYFNPNGISTSINATNMDESMIIKTKYSKVLKGLISE
jgi:glycosyltransferase involved in cell wall biosynthesis